MKSTRREQLREEWEGTGKEQWKDRREEKRRIGIARYTRPMFARRTRKARQNQVGRTGALDAVSHSPQSSEADKLV